MGSEVYHHLKKIIEKQYGKVATCVGDEGGFAPNVQDPFETLGLLKKAIETAGYTDKISIGMDVAASEFYKDVKGIHMYDLDFKTEPNDGSKCVSKICKWSTVFLCILFYFFLDYWRRFGQVVFENDKRISYRFYRRRL